MIKKTLMIGVMTAGVLAGLAMAPDFASADYYYGRQGRYYGNNRSEWAELQRDRQELWRDQAELARDQEDLRRMYRYGASPGAIDRKRAEIRNDLREVRRSQAEVQESYADVRRDGYGYDGSYNRGRWGWGNGWWNRGR
jgi:hypothetical protein